MINEKIEVQKLINESTCTQKVRVAQWSIARLINCKDSALPSQQLPLATAGHSRFLIPDPESGADAH